MPKLHLFWDRVERTDSCWYWKGDLSTGGYGIISLSGILHYAHRLAYQMAFGTIPTGLFVCHRCDERRCVRPDHSFLGTSAENSRDMARKGRAVGKHPSRLTLRDADEIRLLRQNARMPLKELAQRFGTSVEVISHVLQRRTFNLPSSQTSPPPTGPVSAELTMAMANHLFPPTLEELFWSKVDRTGDCWVWLGSYSRYGYGRFHINRKSTPAHRVAYQFTYGPIPEGLVVLHQCDNRACVRPAHLSIGTQSANVADMLHKGRNRPGRARGERNRHAKLTAEKVREIRWLYRTMNVTCKHLAERFGVSPSAIAFIIRRETWKEIGDEPPD